MYRWLPQVRVTLKSQTHTHTILCGYTMYYMCKHLDDFILFWFLFYRFFPFFFLHFSNDLPTTFQSFPLAAAGGPWSGSARGTTLAALWCWECLESKMRGGMLGFLGIAWCLTSKMLRVFFLRKTISLNRVFHGHFRGFWKWDAWWGSESKFGIQTSCFPPTTCFVWILVQISPRDVTMYI